MGQCLAYGFVLRFVGYDHGIGHKLYGLPDEQVGIAACREYGCFELVGMIAHHVESLCAD